MYRHIIQKELECVPIELNNRKDHGNFETERGRERGRDT